MTEQEQNQMAQLHEQLKIADVTIGELTRVQRSLQAQNQHLMSRIEELEKPDDQEP